MPGRIVTNQQTGQQAWWDGHALTPVTPEQRRMAETGFISTPDAPDQIAARQEYATANKRLSEDAQAYKRVGPLRTQLERFEALNMDKDKGGTGGIMENLPFGLSGAYANLKGGTASELASLGANMQVNDIPKGQGQVSNFERSLYALGQPGIEKQGPVNQNIIHQKIGLFNQEGDRLAFMSAFLKHNQTLNGADDAWDKYVRSHPYTMQDAPGHSKGSVAVIDPNTRVSWQEYFGLSPMKQRQAAGPPPAAPTGGGDPGYKILKVH